MDKRSRVELRKILGLPEDEPGVVNVLCYKGTVYGVYQSYDDAYAVAIKKFGEGAVAFLDASIIRKRVE